MSILDPDIFGSNHLNEQKLLVLEKKELLFFGSAGGISINISRHSQFIIFIQVNKEQKQKKKNKNVKQ